MRGLLISFGTLIWTVSALRCWTYNAVTVKGSVNLEEYDYGLLECRLENDVCLTKRTVIEQYAGVKSIKLYATGCGKSYQCAKGSCCRTDGCNERLYALMREKNSKKCVPRSKSSSVQ